MKAIKCVKPRCKKLAWEQKAIDHQYYWWCPVHKAIGKVKEQYERN